MKGDYFKKIHLFAILNKFLNLNSFKEIFLLNTALKGLTN